MLTNYLCTTQLGQCLYPPVRGGVGQAAPLKDLRPPGPSGGCALCAHSLHRHQDASPAPAVVSSAGSGDHCVRSFLRIISREVLGGAKCHHAEPQCFSTVITRIQRPCSASILPPYAAPLLGRSLSGSQQSRERASSLPPLPLLGTASPWSNLAAIPPGLASFLLCGRSSRAFRIAAVRPRQKRRKAFRASRTRPSRPLAQSVSGQASHTLRRRVGARLRHQRPAATRPWVMGRPGPGPGGRLPTHIVGLFRCSREPKVSLPRRSRARRPHASRPPPRPRSTSFRALWHWKTCRRLPHRGQRERRPSLPPGRLRLQDFQHHRPTRDTRPGLGATSTGITRPKAGKRV